MINDNPEKNIKNSTGQLYPHSKITKKDFDNYSYLWS